jgi:hypothetical protein
VYYYGLPNGKVYLVYARFYEVKFDKTDLEFVIAIRKEFCYDVEDGSIYLRKDSGTNENATIEDFEKADPNIKIVKVYRNVNSFKEAEKKLEKRAQKISKKMNR